VTDLRNLPDPVRERLAEGFGPDFLSERHRGFDVDYKGKTLEHRANPRIEIRTDDDGRPVLRGYAAVYDWGYDVAGGPDKYGWTETIVRGAVDKSVREQDEVFLLYNHDGLPLAGTKDGSLTVSSDAIGYYSEARIDPRSTYSMEIVHRVASGLLDAMSWAFMSLRQKWNDDYTERLIYEAKAFDQSVVSMPANPATVVVARSQLAQPNLAVVEAFLAELRSARA
jgi:HK97 family phage prohead protease